MSEFQVHNPDFESRTRDSFARQGFIATLGSQLTAVSPGHVEMCLPYRPELSQQHGCFHGGVIGTMADNVGGYCTLMIVDGMSDDKAA